MHSFFSNIYNISQLLHKIYGIPDIPDVDIQVEEYQYRVQWCSSKGYLDLAPIWGIGFSVILRYSKKRP